MSVERIAIASCFLLLVCALASTAGRPRILLTAGAFDPLAEESAAGHLESQPAVDGPGYYIVQFDGPILEAWKHGVRALGAELLDYVPDFAFVARMTSEAAERVRSASHVRWIGPYQASYKVSPALRAGARGQLRVTVGLFEGEDPAAVEAEVVRAGGAVHASGAGPGGSQVEATVPAQAVERIAAISGVAWIEQRLERRLHNNVARGLMDVNPVWSSVGLFGAGEIVTVCDTGLDTGNLSTISADFAGRVIKGYDLGRKKKWDDPNGHGTHVAGSVLGNGVLSGSNPASHDYAASFAGAAPEARLIIQSILDNAGGLGGLPADLNQLFLPVYNDGARIHTNSWGAAYFGAYTTDSRNVDMFTWNHKDMVVLFSAGNAGTDDDSNGVVDPDSLDSPATAKNCIAVGATENYRLSGGLQGTYGQFWPSDYPTNPIKNDPVSNNSMGMAAFSSRGPTDDGRFKPDVVAPGTNVISARSHAPAAGTLWGAYDANYTYSGGTSMSTPLTAGTAALVREYYRTLRSHAPSAALVKATLINGAANLYPGQYGTGAYLEIPASRPNNVQGWGLIDPAYVITPPAGRGVEFVDDAAGLATGGSSIYSYAIAGPTSALRVTLAWTDYPASVIASKALVNDLDLVVTLPDGSTLRGNGVTDRLNNVEGVDIASPMPGNYTVTVSGYNVPSGPQPFALVVTGPFATAPTAAISAPADGTVLAGAVTIRGTAAGAGFQQYVLEYGEGESPSVWMPIGSPQGTPVEDGVLATWNTTALADGVYTIRLTVASAGGSSADTTSVQILTTSIPAAKAYPDGTSVTLTGKVVSAGPLELGGTLYVQEPERTSGIRVELGTASTDAVIGDLVTVAGTLQTTDGERTIVDPAVVVTGSAL